MNLLRQSEGAGDLMRTGETSPVAADLENDQEPRSSTKEILSDPIDMGSKYGWNDIGAFVTPRRGDGDQEGAPTNDWGKRMHRREKRGDPNRSGKPPSNPRGWPDNSQEGDLQERPNRVILIDEGEQESWFCSNFVRTSKYTVLDFLPKFLMEEFNPRKKVANVYFLVLAALQTVPSISNTFGVPTILLPLSIVVIVDGVFAILEDVARHKADGKANSSPTRVLDRETVRFRRVEWSSVRVGDFVLVKNREPIPADLLVMGVHEPNPDSRAGICYVESKSLDGETNLKIRQAVNCTNGRLSSPEDLLRLKGKIVMEHPNKLIDSFTGTIEVEKMGPGNKANRKAILPRNLLLRGCVLRNSPWVVGLVLNSGPDTKIIMSMTEVPQKSSHLEQRTNNEIRHIVTYLCAVCLVASFGSLFWNASRAEENKYLVWDFDGVDEYVKEFIIMFFYYFLLLGNFIPVSLYVSMSTVKFFQSYFINQDLDMYHENTDTPALVRTMALNEELGQVSG
ncbi:unnamed protein product [Choristocarpus tenellus]